jgi:hypothetical protein
MSLASLVRLAIRIQFEEPLSVLPSNIVVCLLTAQCLLDVLNIPVPPATAHFDRLVWIVDAKEDAFETNVIIDILQCWRREVTTGRDPDVVFEVVLQIFLRHEISRSLREQSLDVPESVVDAPEVERDMLAEMDDNDLECGETVEDTIRENAQQVKRDAVGEAGPWAN